MAKSSLPAWAHSGDIRQLREAVIASARASDRLTRWVIGLTVVLVVLTAVLVVLTVVLVVE